MRCLLLLRHAKTERANPGGDHARTLVERGHLDAVRTGQWLARQGILPDAVLVSDAVRSLQTFERLCEGAGRTLQSQIVPQLYLAAQDAILDAVRLVGGERHTLLVIGHNPGLHQLAHDLARTGPRKALAALAAKFPTCALAQITADAESWREIDLATGRLEHFVTAKSLRQAEHADAERDDDC